MPESSNGNSPYRLDLLPVIQVHHWRARRKPALRQGELVYYGPMPSFYGIGEVKSAVGVLVAVDFRGTGMCSVHEDVIDQRYLIPIPDPTLALL